MYYICHNKYLYLQNMENKLDYFVNHRIAMIAGLLKRQIFRIIAEEQLEITPEQWVILNYLWKKDGQTIKELTDQSQKDFANVTRIVENLRKQAYVTKRRNKADGRSTLVYLTSKATAIKPRVEACWERSLSISLQNIAAEEQKQFLLTLGKLEANTQEYLKGDVKS